MNPLNLVQDIDDTCNADCHTLEYPELCKNVLTDLYNFKILTFNIRSIQQNFDSFLISLSRTSLKFDVLILTECWIDKNSVIGVLDGYNCYRTERFINRAGGVVAFVKSELNPIVSEPLLNDANSLYIDIPNCLSILGIYRSPSITDVVPFLNSLESFLETTVRDKTEFILMGDININIINPDLIEREAQYLCLMAEFALLPAVNKPTRKKACLDHIFARSKQKIVSVVCKSSLTDHDLVLAGLSNRISNCTANKRFRMVVDYEKIAADLQDTDWASLMNETNATEAAITLDGILNSTLRKHSHKVLISRSTNNIKPWMTPGLIRCSRHKDKLHAIARKNPDDPIKQKIYTRYRNFYVDLIRKVKTKYEKEELHKHKSNPKQLWKTIKQITHTQSNKSQFSHLISNKSDPESCINSLNNYFSTVGQKLASQILLNSNETEESLAAKVIIPNSPTNSFFLEPTDPYEIEELIANLKADSAPGLDSFSNRLLKMTKQYISKPLTHIFNLSLSTGQFPNNWKTASVTPVHKGGDKETPGNYRPISLLGAISKLLERVVNKRLTGFLESNGLLSDRQYGFRRHKSTEQAVCRLSDIVVSKLDKGDACIGVFLDLAKAFDSVSTTILLKKLDLLGVRGLALDWFTSYLTGREQCIKVESYISHSQPCNFGVPQGSILGPTLFLAYMNDITSLEIANAEIVCYADDTAIIFHGNNWESAQRNAEIGMATVSNWLNNNLLTLNTSKTKFVNFFKTNSSAPSYTNTRNLKIHSFYCPNHPSSIATSHNLSCNCNSISKTDSVRYLGIILDEKLNFKKHIDSVSGRVRKLASIMRLLRPSADPDLLKSVYIALCQSIITYCITSWGGIATSTLLQLERSQRCVLKVMLFKNRLFSTELLHQQSDTLSVRQLYIQNILLTAHKSVLNSDDYKILSQRRVFKIPVPFSKTSFAHHYNAFLRPFVYNKAVKCCDIKYSTTREAKAKIRFWLRTLDYQSTEKLIRVVQ